MSDPIIPTSLVFWADFARKTLFEQWLSEQAPRHALRVESLRPASADASFRRYLRIDTHDGASRIIMDAPPDKENCDAFVQVQALMAQADLPVPHVFDWDKANGFMLLSDVGQRTLIEILNPAKPRDAEPWYREASDLLLRWQLASKPGVLPAYDEALLRRELQLFPDWYIGEHRQKPLSETQQAVFSKAFDSIVAHNLSAPSVYVHRDYMARNLMLPHPGNTGLSILDFQDAVYGPVTYDIASLLRDAFLTWEEDFTIDITVRYWEKARKAGLVGATSQSGWGDDFGEFYRAVEWMGLQRHLKVAGIFARLTLRDGKPKYLADTPRFIHYIRSTCDRYRQLGPLLKVIDEIENIQPQVGYAYGRM